MKRWFIDLPVTSKLLLPCGLISPFVLGMIVIDVSLSIQQTAVVSRFACASGGQRLMAEIIRVNTLSHQLLLCNLLLGGLAILLGCVCSIVMAHVITRPLRQVQEAAHMASTMWLVDLAGGLVALAQGDWSVSIPQRNLPPFYESQDELGQIAQSVHRIITTLQQMSHIYELTRQELQGLYTRIREQNDMLSIDNNHLNSLATTDPLTNLPNHRAIMDKIDEELLECHKSQQNCAIIFVDVDHFKHINDIWGHGAGDAVLRFIGQQLRAFVREEDYVGRYGGEEFAILLTNIEQYEAFELAERLRLAIAEQPYQWEIEETQSVVSIAVTASFGLAVYPLDGITKKELIEIADSAMYYAKHSGRNRVCLPGEESLEQQDTDTNSIIVQQVEQGIVQALSMAEQLHDQETHTHALRMLFLAEATTRALGRSEEEVMLIRMAAQMHDIGKIGIPDAILHKPGPLSEQEWTVMRHHPRMSQQILAEAGGRFELVSHIVVAHHERWDGRGYPYGLFGNEIPLGARILAVVDSYDAMTSSRPYRKALSEEQAREELIQCKGVQYDPQVVDAFLHVLREQDPQKNSPLSQFSEQADLKESLRS